MQPVPKLQRRLAGDVARTGADIERIERHRTGEPLANGFVIHRERDRRRRRIAPCLGVGLRPPELRHFVAEACRCLYRLGHDVARRRHARIVVERAGAIQTRHIVVVRRRRATATVHPPVPA